MTKSFLLMALLSMAFLSCGDDNKNNEVEPQMTASDSLEFEQKDWIVLFDGENMDQWRGYNTDSMYSDNWTIENGALKFTPDTVGGKNIITKDKFENFILSLFWKVSEGANSGIFYSVYEDEKFNEAYQTGPEIQVLDNERHPDAKVAGGTHKAGSLYDLIACDSTLINPAGEWNKCVLEIDHSKNQGKVTMNDTEAFTFPVHGKEWDSLVLGSKFDGWDGFGTYRNGHLGLQDHGDMVWFKDIKVKRLPDTK